MKPKSKILIIAGSDSSGGAGIQADLKTITCLGSYAMTAVTAVTVQNTQGVKSVIPIPPKEIKNQIIFTARDIKPDAIKIGMLNTSDVVKKVILSLKKIKTKKIILDTVMVAKGGTKLIEIGAKNVLIKGGHLKSRKVEDIFLNKLELKFFVSKRYNTKNTHGTGCTLSSAITTFFSCGKHIKKASELGIKYVNSAILT